MAKTAAKSKVHTETINVLNRWTGAVRFTASIETTPEMTPRVKLGLAVCWGHRNGAALSGAVLSGAVLRGADLSGAVLSGAVLSGADLSDAVLRDADLRGADLSGADLSGAVLSGAVLSGADLSDAVLSGAALSGAVLSGAVLRGAVLSGFPIKIPNIHQAVYAAASAPQALDMATWHTCETTHCRAGWVTMLAGDGGKAIEWAVGPAAAAALIYAASDPKLEKVPNFYATNDEALADMKRLAEAEAAR